MTQDEIIEMASKIEKQLGQAILKAFTEMGCFCLCKQKKHSPWLI
jgi:hypothetical protein